MGGYQVRLLEPHRPRWSILWLCGAQGRCDNELSLGKQNQREGIKGKGTRTACGTPKS
jgi:hypothetical protein